MGCSTNSKSGCCIAKIIMFAYWLNLGAQIYKDDNKASKVLWANYAATESYLNKVYDIPKYSLDSSLQITTLRFTIVKTIAYLAVAFASIVFMNKNCRLARGISKLGLALIGLFHAVCYAHWIRSMHRGDLETFVLYVLATGASLVVF